jgi:ribonucleoside-diphosphate reductase alpha chain
MNGITNSTEIFWKEMVFDALVKDASVETTSAKKVVDDIEEAVKSATLSNPAEIYKFVETQLIERGFNFALPKIRFKSEIKLIDPVITRNALEVLKRRYLKKNEEGKVIETPKDLFWRVARAIAEAETLYDSNADVNGVALEFYNAMATMKFLPNSPTLMNAGKELGQLSACFVLPVGDSMDTIFEAIKNTALIHKSGGGTGFSFSRIRPKNDVVRSTHGVSSGPVSFMQVFDAATETIKQGGTRRGANMGILRVDHPDIMEFITCKQDKKRLNNFNISVGITVDFMRAVENDEDYDLINPRTKTSVAKLKARDVFNKIVEMAWLNGEPGIVFLDRLNRDNPTPKVGEIESTNPCGEQPLLPFESCNLGSINLEKFVKNNHIDYDSLKDTVRTAVHFLDNVIDVNKYPLKQIEEMTKANRKIGLGVMGFADLLLKLAIPYNSEDALKVAEDVMSFIQKEGRKMSQELAEIRGEFPNFKDSIYNTNGKKMRNATITTIAPTGTISMIAGCSSGIEPLFAITYIKNVLDNTPLIECNQFFIEIAKQEGFYSDKLIEKISKTGRVSDIPEVPERWRRVFVTAHEITPEWHVRMQAAFQKYTDNAVSKTVNFPKHATKEDVAKVYIQAYKLGCKGVTVYRDGSRDEQVLNINKVNKEDAQNIEQKINTKLTPRPRPEAIRGVTRRMTTGCGNLYVTINCDEIGPFEVFTSMGKAGGCATSQAEAIGRLISLALRAGVDPEHIVKQLAGVRCPVPAWEKGSMILSCADAISKALKLFLDEHANGASIEEGSNEAKLHSEKKPLTLPVTTDGFRPCPHCGSPLVFEEGCYNCKSCGYSKCA